MSTILTQTAQQLTVEAIALHKLAFSPGVTPAVQSEALSAASDCSDRAATLYGIQLAKDTDEMKTASANITAAQQQLANLLKKVTNVAALITSFANYLKAVDALITIAKLAAAA